MERIKVAALVTIALSLARLAFGLPIDTAQAADTPPILCEAFYAENITNLKQERAVETGRVYAAGVKQWLESHPGNTVFRTTLLNQIGSAPAGYIDVICVR